MIVLPRTVDGYPMAPSQEDWERYTPAERAEVVAALPGEVTDAEMPPPEGDRHFGAKTRALDALRRFFSLQQRRVYVSAELPVYYPGAPRFAPDLLVVFDVEDKERDKFVVSAEGRGLDWVMEVHVGGDRKKSAELAVARYASLAVPEYFLVDAEHGLLSAYRLATPDARSYVPIVPQQGVYESRVLGLDVFMEGNRPRFRVTARLDVAQLIRHLEVNHPKGKVTYGTRRHEEEARLGEEDARLLEERRRREDAEREIARLREELARFKK